MIEKLSSKIAIVLPNLLTGGAESVMVTIANNFSEYANVHLIVGEKKGELLSKISNKVTIHDLGSKKMSRSVFKLSRLFRKLSPTAIYSTMMYNNAIVSLAHRISNSKSLLILREATTPSLVLSKRSKIFQHFVKWSYGRADHVVAVSQGVAEDLKTVLALNNIIMIPNPIISKDLLAKSKEACIHTYFDTGYPVIVTVGKMIEAKDYMTLIKSFSKLLDVKEARLIIVGKRMEGSSYATKVDSLISEKGLSDKVDLVGFDSNPYKYMSKADLFVLSSKREGLPGVLIQALYVNGNVVSTNCKSGPQEILEGGTYGSLVEVGNSDDLATAMLTQIEQPKVRASRIEHLAQYKEEDAVKKYYALSRISD